MQRDILSSVSEKYRFANESKERQQLAEIFSEPKIAEMIVGGFLLPEDFVHSSIIGGWPIVFPKHAVNNLVALYEVVKGRLKDIPERFLSDVLFWHYSDEDYGPDQLFVLPPKFALQILDDSEFAALFHKNREKLLYWYKMRCDAQCMIDLPSNQVKLKRSLAFVVRTFLQANLRGFAENPLTRKDYLEIIGNTCREEINCDNAINCVAEHYFRNLFARENKQVDKISFVDKLIGIQNGVMVIVDYLTLEPPSKNEIKYFVKTHQMGSVFSGGCGMDRVELRELFVYKLLEYSKLGPKIHFLCNTAISDEFFLATEDVAFTEKQAKNKTFATFWHLQESVKIVSIEEKKIIFLIYIFQLLFCLEDIHFDNFGCVTTKSSEHHTKNRWKIIDFRVCKRRSDYMVGINPEKFCFSYKKESQGLVGSKEEIYNSMELEEKKSLLAQILSELPRDLFVAINKAFCEILRFAIQHHDELKIDVKGEFGYMTQEDLTNMDNEALLKSAQLEKFCDQKPHHEIREKDNGYMGDFIYYVRSVRRNLVDIYDTVRCNPAVEQCSHSISKH